MEESWKPVIYRDIKPDMYEVSNFGRFRNRITGHLLTPCPSEKGYLMVEVRCVSGKSRSIKLHRIVAWMFVPGYDELHNEVNHKDGNKLNNHVNNLEWTTHLENIRHAYRNNLIPIAYGESHPNHKMSDDDIVIICESLLKFNGNAYKTHDFIKTLNMPNITLNSIYRVKYKNTGKHISDSYFDDKRFNIRHRIMGDDMDIICKAICDFNGKYSDIKAFLSSNYDITVQIGTIRNIINKVSYVASSDKYFKKGEIEFRQ